jgi:hypothetical protein
MANAIWSSRINKNDACDFTMRKFPLFFLATALFTPAASHAQNLPEVWFQCQSDTDCVKTYACQDVAVNRNYLKLFQGERLACDKTRPSDQCDKARCHDPRAVAQCVKGKCEIVTPDQQK